MQTVKLSNGVEMPVLGFGVYQIPDHDECKKAVSEAIQAGYRLIDTAASYFNEKAVGEAIRESGIPREDFFVTTKLWVQDHGYDATLRAFDTSISGSSTSPMAITTAVGMRWSVSTKKGACARLA